MVVPIFIGQEDRFIPWGNMWRLSLQVRSTGNRAEREQHDLLELDARLEHRQ